MKHWRHFPNKHKQESSGNYSFDSLASRYWYVGAMMCRLWGQHDCARFTIDVIPLMEVVVHGYVMDWTNTLSDRIATEILEFRRKTYATSWIIPPFYWSAYILDIICFNSEYPILGWEWTSKDPIPIHICHKQLRKAHYKNHLYKICNGFVLPI